MCSFMPRSPSLPVRMLAWPTVTEGTEGRLRCFGRGCRCRCSAAQHRQRHCHFYKDCCADFHCLLPVLVCAESAVDVKRYRFVSGFEEREIRQSSTMCLIQLPNRRAWKFKGDFRRLGALAADSRVRDWFETFSKPLPDPRRNQSWYRAWQCYFLYSL